jgi:hypothetical protein
MSEAKNGTKTSEGRLALAICVVALILSVVLKDYTFTYLAMAVACVYVVSRTAIKIAHLWHDKQEVVAQSEQRKIDHITVRK